MKQLKLLFTVLFLAVLGLGNVWAETATLILDKLGASLTSTSNTTMSTTSITATGTEDDYTLNYLQGKKQGDAILLAKSTGAFIANATAMPGDIKSVTVYINSGASGKTTYHCAFSSTACTKAETTGSTAVNITGGNSNKYTCSTTGCKYFCVSLGNANNGQVLKLEVEYEKGGSTETAVKKVTMPTAGEFIGTKSIELSCATDGASIYYTLDGTDPTTSSTLYNGAFTITETTTVKAIAVKDGLSDSEIASATYTLKVIPTFASLEELVAADLTSGTTVTVSFENVPIKSIFVTAQGYRNGIYFNIQKGGNDIEIYYQNVPESWVPNGTVSGTMTCEWKAFTSGGKTTWELAPAKDTWAWTNLSYSAPEVSREQGVITCSYKATLSTDEADDVYEITYNGDGELSVLSSAPAVATISLEGNTVTVHPVAAGSTTITISAPQTENYTEVSKTYTLTVSAGLSAAALPFEFDGGKADMDVANGIKQTGLGTDYSASPKLKFDGTGDEVVIRVADAIKKVEYKIKGNSYTAGQFDILQSADGKTYTALKSYTDDMPSDATKETTAKPAADTRYIKFVYIAKNAGNVALGAINISAASELDSPELAFDQPSYTFFADAADMQVTATSAAGSDGAITYALTAGDADAFLIDENTGDIVCETAGTYTVTATIAATASFASQSVNVVVTINEPEDMGDAISIVFPYGETFYAMKKDLSVVEVLYADNKLYNIAEADKANLTWYKKEADSKATFRNAEGKYIGTGSSNSIVLSETAVNWTFDSEKGYYYCGEATTRTFLLKDEATVKNYAVTNAGSVGYSKKPVFATEFATAELLSISLSGEYTSEFSVGDAFEHEGLIVTANYEGGANKIVTEEATFSTPDMDATGDQTITVSFGGKTTTYTITITAAVPSIEVSAETLAFGSVNKDAVVDSKSVTVTIANLTEATIAISGDGAAKFSVDVTSLTVSGNVTVSATTDEAGKYTATLTISGEGAESKEIALSMTVVNTAEIKNEDVDFTEVYSSVTGSQTEDLSTYNGASYTITFAKNDGSQPKYYANGSAARVYNKNTITIDAVKNIYMVEVTYAGKTYVDEGMTENVANNNHGYVVCDGTSAQVVLTASTTSRITNITVYYEDQKEDVRGGLSVGMFGTICVDKLTLAPAGAHFYTLNQYDAANSVLSVNENTSGRLEAGVPYIFQAEGTEIGGVVVANSKEASDNNGLYAVLDESGYTVSGSETGIYGIVGNEVRPAANGARFPKGRCYIKLNEVSTVSAGAPARAFRVVAGPNTATGFELIEISANAKKVLINNHVYIQRDGKIYNIIGNIAK